jgi:hypothetical protein
MNFTKLFCFELYRKKFEPMTKNLNISPKKLLPSSYKCGCESEIGGVSD